ncbi:MAG: acyl carrier protein [Gemmatimonadota bacterium]
MTEAEVLEGVRRVLRARLEIETPVDLGTNVLSDLQLDSLKRIALVVELENHFRICFAPEDEEGIVTIGDVVRLIRQRLDARDPNGEHALGGTA